MGFFSPIYLLDSLIEKIPALKNATNTMVLDYESREAVFRAVHPLVVLRDDSLSAVLKHNILRLVTFPELLVFRFQPILPEETFGKSFVDVPPRFFLTQNVTYELRASVESAAGEHAWCKSRREDGLWYEFDDEVVTEIDSELFTATGDNAIVFYQRVT